jgi:predicted aldo/keto reductase-like oxidoreductase
MPCPSGVSIPETFHNYNDGMMFGAFDQPRRAYMFTTRFGGDVSKCVRCGLCDTKCPQGISVMENLQKAHERLKGWNE